MAKEPTTLSVFLTPLESIGYLLKRPPLLGMSILPIVINIFLFVLLSWLGYTFLADPLSEKVGGDGTAGTILQALLRFLLTAALIVISGLLSFLLILPVSAPFCDLISEKIEKEMLAGRPDLLAPEQTILKGILYSVKDALQRISFVLPIIIFLFLLGLVPFIGPPIASLLGLINAVLFLSIDSYSYSMDRREICFREKWRFLKKRKHLWIPLGLGLSVFMLVPCSIVLVPVLSAVSGTRQFCRAILRESGVET